MTARTPSKLHLVAATLSIGLLLAPSAWAGRPLNTDDASTTEAGTCQIESWAARDQRQRAVVVAPACGLAPGLELAADHTRLSPRDDLHAAAGLAFKWAPEDQSMSTPAGELHVGLKLASSFARPATARWRRTTTVVLGLATLQPHGDWVVHANLGAVRDRDLGQSATLLNMALAWRPAERLLVFVETQANDRRDGFGGRLDTAGVRWWLVMDRFGLDATTGRESAAAVGLLWTIGFGWYGLGL